MLSDVATQARETESEDVLERAVDRFRTAGIALPRFAELADPTLVPRRVHDLLAGVGPDEASPLNLFRVHWFNDATRRGLSAVPQHVVLPKELTGVEAPIVVALGDRFPLIAAHKVLAAYGCLAPRVVSGEFDPTRDRAVWPSTGNYCRGGVAISRLMGCRGVAVLPEGMSRERFAWLEQWVVDGDDVVKTPGPRATSRRSTTAVTSWRSTRATSSSTSSPSSGTTSSTTWRPAARSRACSSRWPPPTRRCGCARSSRPPARPARSPLATTSRSSSAR